MAISRLEQLGVAVGEMQKADVAKSRNIAQQFCAMGVFESVGT
jgi:hypothetical protein